MRTNEVIFLIEESLEGGYEAKAIGESIFTEAETLDELKSNIKDAVHCHFEDGQVPSFITLRFVKEETLSV